jgi:hypothetical protein
MAARPLVVEPVLCHPKGLPTDNTKDEDNANTVISHCGWDEGIPEGTLAIIPNLKLDLLIADVESLGCILDVVSFIVDLGQAFFDELQSHAGLASADVADQDDFELVVVEFAPGLVDNVLHIGEYINRVINAPASRVWD